VVVDGGQRRAGDVGDFRQRHPRPKPQQDDLPLRGRQGLHRILRGPGVDRVFRPRLEPLGVVARHFLLPPPAAPDRAGRADGGVAGGTVEPGPHVRRPLPGRLRDQPDEHFLHHILGRGAVEPLAGVEHERGAVRVEPAAEGRRIDRRAGVAAAGGAGARFCERFVAVLCTHRGRSPL